MSRVESLLELIGDTSVLQLRKVAPEGAAELWLKLEQQNPGGSVKDRIALAMLDAATAEGRLAPGGTVVEPTSGNTGIGLALVCAARGYKLVLTMPESMSLERRALLKAYGAELVLTPEAEQMEGAIRAAKALVAARPGAFMPSQFDNPANPAIHAQGTAQELHEAFEGEGLDAFVAAVGTGGTISGVGRSFQTLRPQTRIIAVEPAQSATLSRGERGPTKLQGIGAGFVPANFDRSVVHEIRTVTDQEAWAMKLRLAREEGLLVGISTGANVAVARQVACELGPGHRVVTIACDTGERYFSLASHFEPAVPGAI